MRDLRERKITGLGIINDGNLRVVALKLVNREMEKREDLGWSLVGLDVRAKA